MTAAHPTLPVDQRWIEACLGRIAHRYHDRAVSVGEAVAVLRAEGIRVYAGGGTARDWLAGVDAADIDLYLDRALEEALAALARAFPGVPARRTRVDGFVATWGAGGESPLDLGILRSFRDLRAGDAWTTRFPARSDLLEDALLRDFSVNAFYYDFAAGALLDPLRSGLADLERRALRLVAHPQVLASVCWPTLRIAQFLCRGWTATDGVVAYLGSRADADVLGMGERLPGWIARNVVGKGLPPAAFHGVLVPWLRGAAARERLERSLSVAGGA